MATPFPVISKLMPSAPSALSSPVRRAAGGTAGSAAGHYEQSEQNSYIVNESDLLQGRLTFEHQRAQNLVFQPHQKQYGVTLQQNYSGVASELSDPTINKADPAWWQKALGMLEPLKYLDIPIELAAEALIDPLSMATGRDLSWVRGTAEREQFEGWKGLFGGDADPERTGFGELFARFDLAADAFEKRPLAAQLGLAAIQIAATMGTGALVKGAATAGSKASLMAKAARAGAMVLDPYEIGFKVAGKGLKKLRKTSKFTDAYNADGTMKLEPTKIGGGAVDEFGLGAKPIEFWQDPTNMKEAGRKMFNRDDDRYSLVGEAIVKNNNEGGPIQLHEHWSTPTQDVLPPILQRGNDMRKFVRGLWGEANVFAKARAGAETPEAALIRELQEELGINCIR